MIKCSVRNASFDGRCGRQHDAVVFLNLNEELATVQKFLNMIKNSAPGIKISTEEIPLSCLPLAMYHIFTVGRGGEKAIITFIINSKGELKSIAM